MLSLLEEEEKRIHSSNGHMKTMLEESKGHVTYTQVVTTEANMKKYERIIFHFQLLLVCFNVIFKIYYLCTMN